MKTILSITASIVFAVAAFGQQSKSDSSFNWNDSTLKINSRRTINITYTLDGPCTVEPCYETNDNHFVYDTLIDFLRGHPTIKIEIASYNDLFGSKMKEFRSQGNADGMKQILISKGISGNRIIAVGYGNKNQIVPEDQIGKLPKQEQWKARRKNTRFEIVIKSN